MDNKFSPAQVLLAVKDSIATILLNRPEKNNAFNAELISSFIQAITEINLNPTIKLVILRGAGKNFSAGADLAWMRQAINFSKADNIADASKLAHMLQLFNALSKPTIGIINGAVYGGAIGLIACCDLTLAIPNTTFCFSEVKLGLAPAIISPFIVNAIGVKAARRLMLTAEVFDCQHALNIGLINEIIEGDQLELKLNKLSSLILQNSSEAMAATKNLLLNTNFTYLKQAQAKTINLIANLRTSPEAQQRLKNFLEATKK